MSHEEADILITQHAISLPLLGESIRVVCDDTDVFVLLIHFNDSKCKNSNVMIMSSSLKEWDIGATAEAHSGIANDMLAIHGLSGADIVATLHGIGKATVIKVSKTGLFHSLNLVLIRPTWNLLKLVQRTSYVPHTATKSYTSMTECRVDLKGSTQNRKSGASSLKLCSLPPTSDVFNKNVHRG